MTTSKLYALRADSTVISPDRTRVVTFDREGRLFSYFRQGLTYRRDLASRLYVRGQAAGAPAIRWWQPVPPDEARAVMAEAYALAGEARPTGAGTAPELRRRLDDEILRWTPDRLAGQWDAYREAYPHPPSILPPDRYLSTVLQATFGCTWNRCTFCALYRDRRFHARDAADFEDHARRVRRLLGRQWPHRQGLFLGDGNALALSLERLEPLVQVARRVFPGQDLYGFVDLYTGQRAEPAKWSTLARLGLRRVYIGMETGDDELLRLLNKPGSAAELAEFVGVLKEAGLAVGLILMVGAGGRDYAERHARATVAALASMPLDARDLIYLSPFIEQPTSPYPEIRRRLGLEPMTEDEIEHDLEALMAAIRDLGLRAGRYDLRAFVY